MLCLTEIL